MGKRKKRKRKIQWKKWFKMILFLAILGLFTYVFVLSDLFYIREITYHDQEKVAKEELEDRMPVQKGDHIFLAKTKEAARDLEKIPYVKTIDTLRVFPDELKVYVTERIPYIAYYDGENYAYVDEEKVVVEITDVIPDESMPMVTGVMQKNPPVEGETFEVFPTWLTDTLFASVATLKQAELFAHISEIHIEENHVLSLYTNGGSILQVRDEENISQQIDFIFTFLKENDDRMIVDITHGVNPI
ncbi:MAG TPA: hypothetical protein DHN33_05360, partial [Eubacteriaceae bacterium]|nr:hypothetical protein [Eubacteriaceae bacterium]